MRNRDPEPVRFGGMVKNLRKGRGNIGDFEKRPLGPAPLLGLRVSRAL